MISNSKRSLWLAVMAALTTSAAFANDVELASINIPASACQPVRTDNTQLELTQGAYVFRNGTSGQAELLCPLPVTPWAGGAVNMKGYRIYYRDPSGNSTSASVSAQLRYRTDSSDAQVGTQWISDCVPGPGIFCALAPMTNTSRAVPLNHAITGGRLYHFLVKLYRDPPPSGQHSVAFTGIDFPVSAPGYW